MKKQLAITLLFCILAGALANNSGCGIPVSYQIKMKSDELHIQAKDVQPKPTPIVAVATKNLPAPPAPVTPPAKTTVEYNYTYKGDEFEAIPTTAFGINSFDFDSSSYGNLDVVIDPIIPSKTSFRVGVSSKSNWKNIKINFLATTRPDIELGSASLAAPCTSDTFTVDYKFKNKWSSADFLRYKVFISGFSLRTNEQNNLRVNLQKADVSGTGISLLYSTRQSSTIIDAFAVNLVIFDGYNPAFRFAEGVVTQSYLLTQVSIQVPKQGLSEVRNYMIGLTSFEVSSTSAISLFSTLTDKFVIEVGSKSSSCEVNLISVSYLILSVFPECGACHPYSISHNGKCVEKCPDGFYLKNGKCEIKGCQPGFYLNGNNCVKCPRHSDIKQCNNACPVGTKLEGEDCVPVCKLSNQVWSYDKCVCTNGFYRISGACTKCPAGTKYDYCTNTCVSICPKYSTFVEATGDCLCDQGYYMFHGSCIKCASGQAFDLTWGCHLACGENQVFNGKTCICKFGYEFISGKCGQCGAGFVYDPKGQVCKPVCSNYEIWEVNRCICAAGYYRIQGVCKKCADSEVYEPSLQACRPKCQNGQIWIINKCQCNPGSYFIANSCQICPVGTKYDASTQKCEKICKLPYQQFFNGVCRCIKSFVPDKGGVCAPKICPDDSTYNAISDTCVCNHGYYLSKPSASCEKIPVCPTNGRFDNGICVCNTGFTLSADKKACIKCETSQYEIFNGQTCVCQSGYTRNAAGKCIKIVLPPTCKDNEVYDPVRKDCFCIPGCERVKGVCIVIPKCKANQYFNGQRCVCESGFVVNEKTGLCEKIIIPIPIPNCPYNSKFNGVKCVCNEKFFELQPGVCAICPPTMTWNGRKCAYDKNCWPGYTWDNITQCCVPIGAECPENSKWNGQACQCDAGYNAYDGACIRCQNGYQWDGAQCSKVPEPVVCLAVSRIAVNNKCVCKEGFHEYNGICIECPYPTVWNGQFCQGNNDGCFTVPYSEIDPVNRRCRCILGYRAVHGTCVPIPGYLYQNGYRYDWASGYRWVPAEDQEQDDDHHGGSGHGGHGQGGSGQGGHGQGGSGHGGHGQGGSGHGGHGQGGSGHGGHGQGSLIWQSGNGMRAGGESVGSWFNRPNRETGEGQGNQDNQGGSAGSHWQNRPGRQSGQLRSGQGSQDNHGQGSHGRKGKNPRQWWQINGIENESWQYTPVTSAIGSPSPPSKNWHNHGNNDHSNTPPSLPPYLPSFDGAFQSGADITSSMQNTFYGDGM